LGRIQHLMRSVERQPVRWLGGIFAAALLLRGLALWLTLDTPAAGDEPELYMRSVRLAWGGGFADDAGRAPGLLVFYAAAFHLLETAPFAAKLANGLVSSLTVLPIYAIGRRFGGSQVGLLAAAGVAFYPTFVAFSHFLWSAPLYMLLVAWGVAILLRAVDEPRPIWLAAAGVVLGASALVKEAGLLFPLAAVAWVVWRERDDVARAALRTGVLTSAIVLTLAPWVIHVNEPGQPFVLVTRTGSMNLFIGNHPLSHGHGMREYPNLGATRLDVERVARERAWAEIRERMPGWPLEKLATEVPRFFTPTSFAVRRLLAAPDDPGGWGYRFRFAWGDRRDARVAAVVPVVASYGVVALAGVAGLVLAQRRDLATLFGLFIASQIAPSVVTFAMSRFRLASMLFLILGAAAFAASGRRDIGEASLARRATAVGTVLLVLLFICMDYRAVLESTGR